MGPALIRVAMMAGKGLGTVAGKVAVGKYAIPAVKVAGFVGKGAWVTVQVAAGIIGAGVIGAITGGW